MSDEMKVEFEQFLDEMVFIVGLHYAAANTNYIANYDSTIELTQLKFTEFTANRISRNLINFVFNYRYKNRKTLTQMFNHLIDKIGSNKITIREKKFIEDEVDSWAGVKRPNRSQPKTHTKQKTVKNKDTDGTDKNIVSTIKKIMLGWFERKNKVLIHKKLPSSKSPTKKQSKNDKSKRSKEPTIKILRHNKKTIDKLEILCGKFVSVYWKLAQKLKIPGFDQKEPSIRLESSDGKYYGIYDANIHTIVLNIQYMIPSEVSKIVTILEEGNITNISSLKNETWDRFFSYTFPASTIVHELEHARRGQNHTNAASHGDIEIQLPGKPVKTYKFNQLVNEIYNLILLDDFWSEAMNS